MDKMNELFYKQPYTKEFDATINACHKIEDHYEIVLSDTAFYPEGGGQQCDLGTIDGVQVINVQRKDGFIFHSIDKELTVGNTVHCVVDWSRRFIHMQEHSGEHLVSGLVHQKYGFDNVGFHMGEMIQIDFDGELSFDQMREIENQANNIIYLNEPIIVTYPNEEERKNISYRAKKELHGVVRIVTIPDGDTCACCGTHTATTGEIGVIRILSCEKHKHGTRVLMLAGEKALQYDQKIFDQNHQISVMLSSRMLETSEAVNGLLQQLNEQRYQIGGLQKELISYQLQQYPANQKLITIFEKDMDRETMRQLAVDLVEKKNCGVAAVLCQQDDMYGYVLLSHTLNLKEYSKFLNENLHGQGGGTSDILQGNFKAKKEDIEDLLKQVFENLER